MRRLLDETDYQLSPYIKLNGGLTLFDHNNSPVKSSSPSFTSSPSLRLCPITRSGQYQRQRARELKQLSANIIKAPEKAFRSSMNPEKANEEDLQVLEEREVLTVTAFPF
jgi:hypothetical protein